MRIATLSEWIMTETVNSPRTKVANQKEQEEIQEYLQEMEFYAEVRLGTSSSC